MTYRNAIDVYNHYPMCNIWHNLTILVFSVCAQYNAQYVRMVLFTCRQYVVHQTFYLSIRSDSKYAIDVCHHIQSNSKNISTKKLSDLK